MALVEKFKDLVNKDVDTQVEFFLKSFIFALEDKWKDVATLGKTYKDYIFALGEGNSDLNPTQAADFLQKNGKTRTAIQRREELKDIDLDKNDRITFIEYLLLHYKAMILTEYYKRTGTASAHDLSNDAIGVTGVGPQLLDELFTFPVGLDPELERAIEEFTQQKREKETKIKDLKGKAAAGGVKGLAAENELKQVEAADQTSMNRIELTLNAAKKRASKTSSEVALNAKKKKEEEEQKSKLKEGRNKLKEKAALWQ
eukprot:TRINITY_DN16485_c0_g1_i1.p1 TRINITY_DN16485_c0_g1~~TRINITY_DN16485_c0_g1_i1.p1  ORF type:complete len:257 (+),score=93.11 TRINITY_DN16485_c0_g1_i1:44-814(+)